MNRNGMNGSGWLRQVVLSISSAASSSMLLIDLVFLVVIVAAFRDAVAVAICLGAALAGSFVGFLFGIPRVQRSFVPGENAAQARLDDSADGVRLNSNFQAISDWLTLGLTVMALANLEWVSQTLLAIGKGLVAVGPFAGQTAHAAATIVLGAACLGFLQAFVWANSEYIQGLRSLESRNRQLQQRVQAEIEARETNVDLLANGGQDSKDLAAPSAGAPAAAVATVHGWDPSVWNAEPLLDGPDAASYVWRHDDTFRLSARIEDRSRGEAQPRVKVQLRVARIDRQPIPVGTLCRFLLHPTYGPVAAAQAGKPHVVELPVTSDGTAKLVFMALESFVAGAQIRCEGREHRLRFDLAEARGQMPPGWAAPRAHAEPLRAADSAE